VIRVAVTTDRFDAAAPHFAEVGLDPVSLPCIQIEPADEAVLTQARHAALGADLLLITSIRTLDLLWPDAQLPGVAVAAVGEATAAAVVSRGGRVVEVGSVGLSALTTKASNRLGGSRVVFPRSEGSDHQALEELRAKAGQLAEYEVYRVIPIAPDRAPVEAAVFASPSAVEGWLLGRDFRDIVVGVIGPTTRRAVSRRRPPNVISPDPSHRALARAMASYLEVTG
jgi:uroporphyrinogen-III synthase